MRESRNNRNHKEVGQAGSTGSDRAPNSGRSGRPVREVDLHLPSGHGGPDALERQLARIRGELNSAIRAGEKEIIFIHGGGSGRLREALRDIIAAEYPSCACHDASFARYGYNGATAVKTGK